MVTSLLAGTQSGDVALVIVTRTLVGSIGGVKEKVTLNVAFGSNRAVLQSVPPREIDTQTSPGRSRMSP